MTTVRRTHPRHALAAAALAAGGLLLAACGNQAAGSAATYGDSRVTEQQLNSAVQEVLAVQGQPVDSADPDVTAQTLTLLIREALVDELAAREGVTVTQGAIDSQLASYAADAGGIEVVTQSLTDQGVPPSQIEEYVRFGLQIQGIGSELVPEGTAEEQSQAMFDAVVALSDDLDVSVSPRFGTWDPATLSLGPVPNDLSTPPDLG